MPRKAKKAVKKTVVKGRKRCKMVGCRKLAIPGKIYCKSCLDKMEASAGRKMSKKDKADADYPMGAVMQTSELYALRFGKLDAEMNNDRQSLHIVDLEYKNARDKYELDQSERVEQRKQLTSALEVKNIEYKAVVTQIAKELGLDPNQMSIDPDTCVVRDLREGSDST